MQTFSSSQRISGTLALLAGLMLLATNSALANPGYRLPFAASTSWFVTQGWNGAFSHNNPINRYAYDFDLAAGTWVMTSRSGTVTHLQRGLACSFDPAAPGNYVVISHTDGTATIYYHLIDAFVNVGNTVYQGAVIGNSGNSGFTNCLYHLHFARQAQGGAVTNSQQVFFDEYPGQELFLGWRVTSQNDNRMVLYEHANYAGAFITIPWAVRNLKSQPFGFGGHWSNKTSSVYVPEGLRSRIYVDPAWTGVAETLTIPDPDLTNNAVGNDTVTSVVHDGAFLFEFVNQGGKSEFFTTNDSDLRNNYIFNDQASAVCVPPGRRVTLFEHINSGGQRLDLNGQGCFNLSDYPLNGGT